MLCALASVAVASAVFAAEVTLEQAQTAARNWVRRSPRRMTAEFASGEVGQAKTSKDDDGRTLYHVVEMDGGGFVVTSGDTELPPVIAFSSSGTLDISDQRNPLVALLERDLRSRSAQLPRSHARMSFAASPQAPSDGSFGGEWTSLLNEADPATRSGGALQVKAASYTSVSDVRVAPMVQSRWSQSEWNNEYTFNYYTPGHYVCGCVATAFAQIMRYWRQPSGSVSAGTYTCWVDYGKTQKTMMGGYYDWGSMPLTSSDCSSAAQRQAIGKLLYDIGVASQMGWSYYGSGTLGCVAAQALRHRFGYASAHSYGGGYSGTLSSNLASNEDFRNAILASLDAEMPVAIGIYGSTGGHEVVVDGYGYNGGSLVYCHINCGWSGSQDAWYNLIGEGVTSHAYNSVDEVSYNIHPTTSGDVISGRVLSASGSPVSGATVTLTPASGSRRTATTNARGIYWFRVPANATYSVSASHGGQSSESQSVSLPDSWDTEYEITAMNSNGTVSYTKHSSSGPYLDGKLGNRWGVDLTLGSSSPQPTIPLATALDNTSLTFTTGGAASWFGQTSTSSDGVDAAMSGSIGDGQQTWLQTTVAGPGVLSFQWKVSCEGDTNNQGWDYLSVSIDGEEKARICGVDGSWTRLSYSIPSGTHTVRWQYVKDGNTSVGDDAGYVDQVAWTPTPSPGDSYDPGDDAPGGGTAISPSGSAATHGPHTLSATDKYDFFKVFMTAGYKYVFETTGSMDTYGDIFDSTSLANSVASDDDGGIGRNFRIEFAPESSGTYYLRVRAYTVGTAGSYELSYQRVAADSGGISAKPDLLPYTPSGWTSPLVVSSSNISKEGATSFGRDDSLYVSWAVVCRNADARGTFYSRLYVDGRLLHSWYTVSLQKDYYSWIGGYLVGKLDPGSHTIRIVHDDSNAVDESNESNNALEAVVSVTVDGVPNLKVESASVSMTTISLSDPMTVHWRIKNEGVAPAAASSTSLKIYRTSSGASQLVKTMWLGCPPLAANSSVDCRQAVSLKPFGTGTYAFVIGADGKAAVAESDETDNDETLVAYVVNDIATRSSAKVDWQFHKMSSSEPDAFYLSSSENSRKKSTTFRRGETIYLQLNFWNAKKNVRTLDGVYARVQINGGGSQTWYWPPMWGGTTGYIMNGHRAPAFLQNLPAGSYTLTATLDCYDEWWETNEKNNVRTLSFTVVGNPTIYGETTYRCAVNVPVSWPITTSGKCTAKGLPPGLRYSGGAISGKATKPGTYRAAFTSSNEYGTASKTVTIVVEDPGFSVACSARLNGGEERGVASGDTLELSAGVVQSISISAVPGMAGIANSAVSSVSAKGLPPGLKLSNGVISGVPTKSGTYSSVVTFKNRYGWTASFALKFVVSALPTWAQGSFEGGCGTSWDDGARVAMSVSSAGKMSGKVFCLGETWTMTAPAYSECVDGCFVFDAVLKNGRNSLETRIGVWQFAEDVGEFYVPANPLTAEVFGARLAWSSGMCADALARSKAVGSSRTLEGEEWGLAPGESVTLAFAKNGAVKAKAKLAAGEKNGKAAYRNASASASLVPWDVFVADDGDATLTGATVFLYFPPAGKAAGDGRIFRVPVRFADGSLEPTSP